MQRMDLIVVLAFLVGENEVERHLVGLFHHRTRAGNHPPDMELDHARNRLEIFLRPGQELIGGVRVVRIGPEDDDVREHAVFRLSVASFCGRSADAQERKNASMLPMPEAIGRETV